MAERIESISLADVVIRFGRVKALSNCSASFYSGDRVLLLGGNGAGKTTLLRLAAGLIKPFSGKISYPSGAPKSGESAFLGRDMYLYGRLSVKEMLSFYRSIAGVDNEEIASEWLIEDLLSRKIEELSRGQQMRVALACSMLRAPRFLFLDEPTSVLDDRSVSCLSEHLLKDGAGKTTIIASHDIERLLPCVNRIVLLSEGGVLEDSGEPANFSREVLPDIINHYREHNR